MGIYIEKGEKEESRSKNDVKEQQKRLRKEVVTKRKTAAEKEESRQ